MSTSKTIEIPLELHDLGSFTRAREFGRDMAKKILDVCSTKNGDQIQYDTALLQKYMEGLAERIAEPEDIDKSVKAAEVEFDNFVARKREEEARESNKAKRKGRLNVNESYDGSDDSGASDSEAEAKNEHAVPDHDEELEQQEKIEEKLVELDMSELMRRAEIERVERAKEAEERRLSEEAELKRQRERLEAQKALLERQRQVSTEIPEGFKIISKKNKPKGKGKR